VLTVSSTEVKIATTENTRPVSKAPQQQ